MRVLQETTRTWPMLAALGGGLVVLAVAAGTGGGVRFALAGLGGAALVQGGLSLSAGRIVAPRTVIAVVAATVVTTGALAAAGALRDTGVPAGPLVAAAVLLLGVAVAAAAQLRAQRDDARPSRTPSASTDRGAVDGRNSLLGLFGGAALVATVTTAALAGTDAGREAVPHGRHPVPLVSPGHPGH